MPLSEVLDGRQLSGPCISSLPYAIASNRQAKENGARIHVATLSVRASDGRLGPPRGGVCHGQPPIGCYGAIALGDERAQRTGSHARLYPLTLGVMTSADAPKLANLGSFHDWPPWQDGSFPPKRAVRRRLSAFDPSETSGPRVAAHVERLCHLVALPSLTAERPLQTLQADRQRAMTF